MTLDSLPDGYRAVVFGATGGLGAAFVRALSADPRCAVVHAGSRQEIAAALPKTRPFRFDLRDEASIATAIEHCIADGPLHLVIVATGMLHDASTRPERTWRSLSAAAFQQLFSINTIGPALVAKHALGHLAQGDKAIFVALSARVGSISDNRLGGWHAYRASKAALNMLIRTFAVELTVRNKSAVCVGLHPGTVETALSEPFKANVPVRQLLSTDFSVERLLTVIDGLRAAQSGKIFAWDGSEISF